MRSKGALYSAQHAAALIVVALLITLGSFFGGATGTVAVRAAWRVAPPCATVSVLASRGSGDTLGTDKGLSAPGQLFADTLASLVPGAAEPWANPYNAVGVFSLNLRQAAQQELNGLGALTQLSGLGLGAYHESVVGGQTKLASEIKTMTSGNCAATPLVLVGYSQGAQVAADVFQRDLTATQRSHIVAVVLFGDPYFNGGDWTVDRGSFSSGRRDGALGKRPVFNAGKTLVLSYCHSHDPICQGFLPLPQPRRSTRGRSRSTNTSTTRSSRSPSRRPPWSPGCSPPQRAVRARRWRWRAALSAGTK